MIVVSVFQLISCVAIPISFTKFRQIQPGVERPFRVMFGLTLSYLIYMGISYLLTQASVEALVLALILHIAFFLFYIISFYGWKFNYFYRSFASSWTLFVYISLALFLGFLNAHHQLDNVYSLSLFIVSFSILYVLLLRQKKYS